MTQPIQVDPYDCGCTECLTGLYIPLNRAAETHVAAMLHGEMQDATSEKFTLAITTTDYLSGRGETTVTVTAEHCGRTWEWKSPVPVQPPRR